MKQGYEESPALSDEREEWMDQEIRDEHVRREREQQRRRNRQKRRKKIRRRRICFLLVLVLIGAGIFAHIKKNAPSQEVPPVADINGIPVVQALVSTDSPGRPGTVRRIKYIVIHETGNTGSGADAAAHGNYLAEEVTKEAKSWHYTVDDHEIYHHIPDNEVAFHAGDQLKEDGGNLNGIGIEMCVNPENDYEKTLQNSAALTAYLVKAYHLNIEDVKKHQDFSGKNCPENLIGSERWEEFLSMVKTELK